LFAEFARKILPVYKTCRQVQIRASVTTVAGLGYSFGTLKKIDAKNLNIENLT
jgi:hypothetical protein